MRNSKPLRPTLRRVSLLALLAGVTLTAYFGSFTKEGFLRQWRYAYAPAEGHAAPLPEPLPTKIMLRLANAALQRTQRSVRYDPAYVSIPYPNGDVPDDTGVCTDVVVRSYRALGFDLQKEVHEDMRDHFLSYPKLWRLTRPDPNIDHRRVPNLMTFFKRRAAAVAISETPSDYLPGDLVTWDLGGGLAHIGIVVHKRSQDGARPMIVHNIGAGPRLEDVLFDWTQTGHFRFPPPQP